MSLHQHDDGSWHLPGKISTALLGRRIEIGSYLGLLRISVELPQHAAKVDVHLSSVREFETDAAPLIASMRAPGILFASAPYDRSSYVRFVPFDADGRRLACTTVQVQPTRPVFFDGKRAA